MFQVIELNDKPLSELKEIAKKIGVKADVTKKQDLISSIVDAQNSNPDLAATLSKEFPAKVKAAKASPKAEKVEKVEKQIVAKFDAEESSEKREKRPRKVKLDPIAEDLVHADKLVNDESYVEEVIVHEVVKPVAEAKEESKEENAEVKTETTTPVTTETKSHNIIKVKVRVMSLKSLITKTKINHVILIKIREIKITLIK
jgi:hypothetical protein